MAAGYLLWYGIVRLCLEPLRDHEYTFLMTYVMSSLFVAFGLIFIIINHTVISRKRDVKVLHKLIYKPIESYKKITIPKKIKKLEFKLNTLKSAHEQDVEFIKEIEQELESYKES